MSCPGDIPLSAHHQGQPCPSKAFPVHSLFMPEQKTQHPSHTRNTAKAELWESVGQKLGEKTELRAEEMGVRENLGITQNLWAPGSLICFFLFERN